ncbi:amino acid/polyamine/organocation transporter (APC superfamily) [Alkalibaculum bacchi]|uniref:Amino acid/polyamine/organocation transporter (APC superfamily) n=1 Tax=Alkalibaculum bacchi TaxID=645887 RepID=A0A366IB90_9FIRM|nr:APC family permease [Alkalibaculum bacchi]RBP65938.1 amino acid/polyamine/organocation transporter (APC superfamily) [Alkalibaculum bacchi]
METLQKKYGLWTATSMVVGVVIGSGVFFKADDVLKMTNGNIYIALVAWILGAMAMVFGALVVSEFAQRIEKANGIVDYYERAYGKRMGYLMGWFNGILYYSPLSAILAWISATYTLVLFNVPQGDNSNATWVIAFIYIAIIYIMNYFAPVLAGKLQVTTTVIKLIPLGLIAIVGTIFGLRNGVLLEGFIGGAEEASNHMGSLSSAVVSTAFAFDGWISAVTINNEIKDAKKNLPRALVIGAIIVLIVYVSYFLGIVGVLGASTIIDLGDNAVNVASKALFGGPAGVLLSLFVVISCLGTLNGLIIACIRMPFSLAIRGQGPMPKLLSKVNKRTQMPTYSVIYSFALSCIYLFIWYGSLNNLFGRYIAIDEIPIVLIYGFYILLHIWYMIHFRDLKPIRRYIIPILAIFGSSIIVYGGITNPSIGFYLIISITIILFGLLFYGEQNV